MMFSCGDQKISLTSNQILFKSYKKESHLLQSQQLWVDKQRCVFIYYNISCLWSLIWSSLFKSIPLNSIKTTWLILVLTGCPSLKESKSGDTLIQMDCTGSWSLAFAMVTRLYTFFMLAEHRAPQPLWQAVSWCCWNDYPSQGGSLHHALTQQDR